MGMYKLDKFDERDLKAAFTECGYDKCNFKEQDGIPVTLDSETEDGNLTIVSLDNRLMAELDNGEVKPLVEVLNDEDDVERLIDLIVDYSER